MLTAILIGSFIFIGFAWALCLVAMSVEIKRLNDRIDLLTQVGRRQRTIIKDLYSPQSKDNENQLIH